MLITFKKFLVSFSLIICLYSCNGQNSEYKIGRVTDTAKLFNPFGINDGIEKIVSEKNAILFQPGYYQIALNEKQYNISDKNKLQKFISDSVSSLKRKKFFIIIDSSKSFNEIVEVIELIKKSKIENYQVFNLQSKNIIPKAIVVESPQFSSVRIKHDSTYLDIFIKAKEYEIKMGKDSLITKNISEIDKFISSRRERIKEDKILIKSDSDVGIDKFRIFKNLLKKNNIYRFRIVSIPMTDQ